MVSSAVCWHCGQVRTDLSVASGMSLLFHHRWITHLGRGFCKHLRLSLVRIERDGGRFLVEIHLDALHPRHLFERLLDGDRANLTRHLLYDERNRLGWSGQRQGGPTVEWHGEK